LKTVLASGEASVVPFPGSESHPLIMDAIGGAPSGTWNSQDIVVFGPSSDGSLRQTNLKKGGIPTPVTTRETALHRRPRFLPDGQHFLYLSGQNELRVGALTTADTIVIGTFESPGVYSAGHLLFTRGGNLMAQSFNEETLRLEGNPVSLRVQVNGGLPGFPAFSASPNGPLVFLPPPITEPQLTWLDRDGRRVGLVGNPGVVGGNLDLSPDGQQVAFSRNDATGHSDIWLMELATGRATPLTENAAGDTDAAWSPNGKQIVFNSGRLGGLSLFLRASDGSGVDVPLVKYEKSAAKNFAVASWSRADALIFNAYDESDSDLWTLSMSGNRNPEVFLSSKYSEMNGTFSPDGRWVAYQSNASGRYEVVVRPYANKDPAQTISRDGGKYPRWRGDGKELFFVSPDGTLMASDFDAATGRSRGVPQPLFATQIRFGDNRPYAVDKSGQRFLLMVAPDPRVVAVMDWRTLLTSTAAR
jgi:eukaryotic-like serine/threonine-protein kinase